MPKIAAFAVLALALALPLDGAVAGHLPLGGSSELRCTQKGGGGLIVTSDRPVTCVYYRPDGAVEFYTGDFHRLGVDLGATNAVNLAFRANVPGPIETGALDGRFVGAGAQLTVGHGVGADALVGGATGNASLTPIANAYLTGFDVNGGLGALDLHYRGMERRRDR